MSAFYSWATRGKIWGKLGVKPKNHSDIMFSIVDYHLKPTDGKWRRARYIRRGPWFWYFTHCGTTTQPEHASSCVARVGQTRRETMQRSGEI